MAPASSAAIRIVRVAALCEAVRVANAARPLAVSRQPITLFLADAAQVRAQRERGDDERALEREREPRGGQVDYDALSFFSSLPAIVAQCEYSFHRASTSCCASAPSLLAAAGSELASMV